MHRMHIPPCISDLDGRPSMKMGYIVPLCLDFSTLLLFLKAVYYAIVVTTWIIWLANQ